MRKKKALIFGVTGQDGSYLAEFLIKKGYIVHGTKRKSSSFNTKRIDHIFNNKFFFVHYNDVTDSNAIMNLIEMVKPDEIYNLSAQSHVATSFELPLYTSDVNGLGTLRILEAIKNIYSRKKIKFYQASTSELFGKIQNKKQSEKTDFYAFSKPIVQKEYIDGGVTSKIYASKINNPSSMEKLYMICSQSKKYKSLMFRLIFMILWARYYLHNKKRVL